MKVAAAGDVACDPADDSYNGGLGTPSACQQAATSDLLSGHDAVFALGDLQYQDATFAKFQAVYDPTWGRFKSITFPIAGNHEYDDPGAAGYFAYFGDRARPTGKSYYSFDLGAWHVVALDSNCGEVGGCHAGSPQEQWLRADLAAHPNLCTVALVHHPRWSSSNGGSQVSMDAFWRALEDNDVELMLAAHDHVYERFAPQDADGNFDPTGMVQFTLGMGGKSRHGFPGALPNSLARSISFGVMSFDLHADRFDYNFLPIAGGSYSDSGSGVCR